MSTWLLGPMTIQVLKIIIVISFSYSAGYRLYFSPNENKDIHLVVSLISLLLVVLIHYFENRRKATR